MMETHDIEIRITGKTGEVDGYMEIVLGMLLFIGILVSHNESVKRRPHGVSQIYLNLRLKAPPLGNIGEDDLPRYNG